MKKKKWLRPVLFTLGGGLAGLAYYNFVGCAAGGCAIASNPAASVLYLGLGACAMCFVTWNYAIKTLGPVKTMVYIYLVPVITVICSVLILHETVNVLSGVGTALTLAGLVLSQWDSLKALRAGSTGESEATKEEV